MTIKPFMTICKLKKNHIDLNEIVYSVLPTNDHGLPTDKFKEKTGLEYQDDKLEYISNYKTLKFVSDNISIMNYLADNGYEIIQEDGTLVIETNNFIQQSFFMNFHIGWFKMNFRTNYWGTAILGAFGLPINFNNIKDVKSLFNADSSEFNK